MPRLTDARVAAIKAPAAGQVEHADDLVRGLRLRAGAGGGKAWIVRARVGAKTVNRTLGRYPAMPLARARDAARAMLADLAAGAAPRAQRTFGDLAGDWLERVAKPEHRSWRRQERLLEMHVLPSWRDRPIDEIDRASVRDLVRGIEGDVLPNRVLSIIRTIFRHGLSEDWLTASPADAIKKPKAEESRKRVLGIADARRVYAAADLLGYPFAGFVKLLLLTAQRRTEVAAMRWADIDLEAGTWIIPAGATKSDRAHMVPLAAAAVDILSAQPRFGDHVFSDNGRTHISGFAKAKTRLDAFVAGRGSPLEPWTFHDLRRTVATELVRLGTAELLVGRILNHAVQGVTGKVYALHSYADEKRAALSKWADELTAPQEGRS